MAPTVHPPSSSSPPLARRILYTWLLAAALALAASCASEAPPGEGGGDNNAVDNNTAASNNAVGNNDTTGNNDGGNNDTDPANNDAPANNDVPDPTAEFGEPCRSNQDCVSGFCITSPQGFVCTESCLNDDACEPLAGAPMACKPTENFGADGINICVPTESSLCAPCFQDSNCFGGLCVPTASGSVCGLDCENDGACPSGTSCFRFSPLGDELERGQCLPTNLSCGCDASTAGQTRPCARTDEQNNRCFGVETCDPEEGWIGCDADVPTLEVCDGADNDCNGAVDDGVSNTDTCSVDNEFGTCEGVQVCAGEEGLSCLAAEPAAESCDGRDNDCDGQTDEDFKDDDGLLSDSANCGTCGNDCSTRFPLAAEAACQVDGGAASCVITACQVGYVLAGPTTCLPLASRLCEPCSSDADCNTEVGDACVTYEGGSSFCGRSCGADSPFGVNCPSGYVCGDDDQCVLESGTCLCGPDDSFIRSCSIPDPNDEGNACVGQLVCDQGTLGTCQPPEDVCNGVDDDCNGTIDDGLRDPETERYISDTHCGRCYNDCTLLFGDPMFHADGVCSGLEAAQRGEIPSCVLDCEAGFEDVNGTTVDGCECEVQTPGEDEPDPQGVDSDCDGIDGQIARGVFVSPTGDDGNPGTIDEPLRTIQAGIDQAGGQRDHVYVAAGVYDESIALSAGVSVFGGYSSNFLQRDLRGNETAIFGLPPTDQRRGAVNAVDVTGQEAIFSGFTVVGANNLDQGGNSYAVYLRGTNQALDLRYNVIRAGNGGTGVQGESGPPADPTPDNAGAGETVRLSNERQCQNSNQNRSDGGAGGSNSCTDEQGNTIDASGGDGGTADCPTYDVPEPSGVDGMEQPEGGVGGPGGYSSLLIETSGCRCLVPTVEDSTGPGVPGTDGDNGDGGEAGQGCETSSGLVVGGQWVAGQTRANANLTYLPSEGWGGKGWKGLPGGGGGGGGAGAGIEVQNRNAYFFCDTFEEALGGGGGGGGAGACGGGGGMGGGPGGGSFAVFVSFDAPPGSLPRVHDNVIERGVGGDGGDGGGGADGADGALGRIGRDLPSGDLEGLMICADPGGRGGDGGDGGAGGGGGGGCGGISAGVFVAGHNGLPVGAYTTSNTFPDTGRGGLGGQPGASIGNSGGAGGDGLHQEVVQ